MRADQQATIDLMNENEALRAGQLEPFNETKWHCFMHLLGLTRGSVVTALDKRGTVWIGFKCVQCGRVGGIHASYAQAPHPSEFN